VTAAARVAALWGVDWWRRIFCPKLGEYAALRQFLAGVAKADRAALVLRCAAPPAAAVPAAH